MIKEKATNASFEVHVPSVNLVAGVIGQPQPFIFEEGAEQHRLLFSCQGSALVSGPDGHTSLLSAGSALLVPKGSDCRITLGRGSQKWLVATWAAESNAIAFTSLQMPKASHYVTWHDIVRRLALRETTETVKRSLEASETDAGLAIAWTNLVTMNLEPQGNQFCLAEIPPNLNESLANLFEAIKAKPERAWSLSEAATLAGYSPFHLSRVFRSVTEIGFPEYVDRCRAEVAVRQLLESEQALSEVAERAGFGSPQAMRGALREYTGFLPSEYRQQAPDQSS